MPGRLTLGLYNSYDPRRFTEAHRRALVRAAPLALAYDANLATFGFPYADLASNHGKTAENRSKSADAKRGQTDVEPPSLHTPIDIARYIARTTSVAGTRGSSDDDPTTFLALAEAGRFNTFDIPHKGFPPQLGTPILTTERAECPKDTSPRAIARDLTDGKSQLLIFGLGPHGTPEALRDIVAWQLDITGGKNIGLETATAMGAVTAAIHAHVEMLAPHAGVRPFAGVP